jgi:trans-aconitate methyltransferase
MSLAEEYLRQDAWRSFDAMLEKVPLAAGQRVLDLGCGPGTMVARLAAKGAEALGVDQDNLALKEARERAGADGGAAGEPRFLNADLRTLNLDEAPFDGLWSSFAAAYFPDFGPVLERWIGHLKPGAWLAITEVEAMFEHRPLEPNARAALEEFATEMQAQGRYDFDMGAKLADFCSAAGLEAVQSSNWADAELAFQGPAAPDVLEAWRRRFARLTGMREFLGQARFVASREALLHSLSAPDHEAEASVVMVLARKP